MTATVALDPQEAVFQQSALQVILELAAYESRQVPAAAFDLLQESRVVFSNNGIERGLLGPMPVVGGRGEKLGRSRHRT
jgi:hypothetical protein